METNTGVIAIAAAAGLAAGAAITRFFKEDLEKIEAATVEKFEEIAGAIDKTTDEWAEALDKKYNESVEAITATVENLTNPEN